MVFLSAGNRVHAHEDSGRCELALTNGWTAGQAVPEDCSPRSELGGTEAGVLDGEGLACKDPLPLPLINCRNITRFYRKTVLYFFIETNKALKFTVTQELLPVV